MRRLLLVTMAMSLSAGVLLRAADDLVISRFSDYLDSLRLQAGIPGLAATVVRPEGTWERGFGVQDVDRNIGVVGDTPFHVDGITQIVSAAYVLRCVEDGRLTLDDPIGRYAPNAPDPTATIRQLLSHTSGSAAAPAFSYRVERLDPLAAAIASCAGTSFRSAIGNLLDRFAMVDSVPGPDVVGIVPPAEGMTAATLTRYGATLQRLARPYAIDARGRPNPSQYVAPTLTPGSGLIATVRDLARFDVSLRRGALLRSDTLAVAWTPPADTSGQRLPHGLGWFVQAYNGERIVWQFGVEDNASSSLIVTVPGRALTLVLAANSQGLSRPFALAAGDVTISPFARTFLSVFVR